MASGPGQIRTAQEVASTTEDVSDKVRQSFLEGLAVLLPLLVTLLIISFALGFIFEHLNPLVVAITAETDFKSEPIVAVLTVAIFLSTVFGVGIVSRSKSGRSRISTQFHRFMQSIPAIGSVYTSFNQMSHLLLDSDTDSFQDVKLVEYPTDGSYAVAFKTAETPEAIAEETDNDDMVTLFMPMAPNPVMGGFVVHVARDRVVDADLTVEEGVRSIVTSGVATRSADGSIDGLNRAQMRSLSSTENPENFAPVGNDDRFGAREDDAGDTGGTSRDGR